MPVEQNKAVLTRIHDEIWNKGNMSAMAELIAPEFICHGAGSREYKGPKGYEELATLTRTALPDARYAVDEMVGEGDRVTARISYSGKYTGRIGEAVPTGRTVSSTNVQFWRFSGGKAVEAWLGFISNETITKNVAVLRRYYEEYFHKRDLSGWNDMVDKDYVMHVVGGQEMKGIESAKQRLAQAPPDLSVTIDEVAAQGDIVAVRGAFKGTHTVGSQVIPATGKKFTREYAAFYRFKNGKIAEGWTLQNVLGYYQQLGVKPPTQ